MQLSIDTSDRKVIKLKLNGKGYKDVATVDTSQRLLPFINEVLKKEKIDFKELKGIRVNTGPGSFTGLRVGVAVAQALGWALGIKVNGRNILKGETISIKYK